MNLSETFSKNVCVFVTLLHYNCNRFYFIYTKLNNVALGGNFASAV